MERPGSARGTSWSGLGGLGRGMRIFQKDLEKLVGHLVEVCPSRTVLYLSLNHFVKLASFIQYGGSAENVEKPAENHICFEIVMDRDLKRN